MAYLIGCLMASLSFLVNKLLIRLSFIAAILGMGPAVEEICKTMLAYWLGADILTCHLTFGIIEGSYDWYTNKMSIMGGKAAVLSVVGHTLFGLVTVCGLYLTQNIWVGLIAGITFHIVWNYIIIKQLSAG